jgi:hypothetical protein
MKTIGELSGLLVKGREERRCRQVLAWLGVVREGV